MTKDLIVLLEDRPGTLAELGEALGKAGVNIEGLCGLPIQGKGVFHILVEDTAAARRALEAAKFQVQEERDVLVLKMEDRPGEIGRVCRRIAAAGVNITLTYLATNTRVVFGVDNLDKARSAAQAK
ncbi:MAG: ACT domain-containing protein [Anaerolineales bacterium]|nr:ACT domain-containing protein [Anaerolineales bacterium]